MPEATAKLNVLISLKSAIKDNPQALKWLRNVTAGLGAAAGAYAVLAAKQSLQLGADLKNLAQSADLSTDAFQVLTLNGERWNVKIAQIAKAAQTLRKNLQEARVNGTSPLNNDLKALNLTAAGLQALAPERQWEVIGRGIANASDKQAALNAATKLFGEEDGPRLLGMLEALGTEGYDKLAKGVESIVLDQSQIDDLAQAEAILSGIVDKMKWLAAHGTVGLSRAMTSLTPEQSGVEGASKEAAAIRARIIAAGNNAERLATIQESITKRRADLEADILDIYRVNMESNAPLSASDQRADTYAKALLQDLKKIEDHLSSTTIDRDLKTQVDEAAKRQEQMSEANAQAIAEDNATAQALEAKTAAELAARDAAALHSKRVSEGAAITAQARTPLEAYADEVFRLSALQKDGIISGETYLRAIAQAQGQLSSKTTIPAAQLSLNRELLEITTKRAAIDSDFTSTAAEKWSQRKQLLEAEVSVRERYIANLRKMQEGADPQSAATYESLIQGSIGQIGSLQDQSAGLGADPDDWSDQMQSQLTALRDSWGTTSQQIAGMITGTIGGAVDTLGDNITASIFKSQTLGEAWNNIQLAIGQEAVSAIVKFGLRWVATKLMMAGTDAALAATQTATLIPLAAAQSAIWAGPATLATIASFGGAAVAAPAHIAASMMLTQGLAAIPGHEDGGHVRGGKQLSWLNESGEEYVFSAPAVAALGVDTLETLHRSAKEPTSGSSSAGGLGSSSGPARQAPPNVAIFGENMRAAKDWAQSQEGETWFLDSMAQHMSKFINA